ncbi:hypothetical protein [Cohaesibacter celericrescens]|uniref:hypothetical protein n=1 Tax=Cohaesibacter celericrescens TaxID=2067669 RepID=UPI00356914A6
MRIEILTAQNDLLKETGFGSLKACTAIMNSIAELDHTAVVTVCCNLANLREIANRQPDFVVLAMKYIPLESGHLIWLSEYFETHDISYTGSKKDTLYYDYNKVTAKKRVASQGIAIADFFVTLPNEFKAEPNLPFPLPQFIKPLDAANGNGVDRASIAQTFRQYEEKVEKLYAEYGEPVSVEEYLDGREFTVAIIEDGGQLIASPIEVVPPDEDGYRLLGSKVKSENTELLKRISVFETHVDAVNLAKKAFIALGARDSGRIDVKMDQYGECHFIEANLVPGMTMGSSYFPRSCEIDASLSYDEVVNLMIQGAIARQIPNIGFHSPTDVLGSVYGPPIKHTQVFH